MLPAFGGADDARSILQLPLRREQPCEHGPTPRKDLSMAELLAQPGSFGEVTGLSS